MAIADNRLYPADQIPTWSNPSPWVPVNNGPHMEDLLDDDLDLTCRLLVPSGAETYWRVRIERQGLVALAGHLEDRRRSGDGQTYVWSRFSNRKNKRDGTREFVIRDMVE